MINEADVVVIGSGGLGAATAFYLAKRGVQKLAVVEKHDPLDLTPLSIARFAAQSSSEE